MGNESSAGRSINRSQCDKAERLTGYLTLIAPNYNSELVSHNGEWDEVAGTSVTTLGEGHHLVGVGDSHGLGDYRHDDLHAPLACRRILFGSTSKSGFSRDNPNHRHDLNPRLDLSFHRNGRR
jgi:hypothetical protein